MATPDVPRVKDYSPVVPTTVFAYPFKVLETSDLTVRVTDSLGVASYPSFTASGLGNESGGNVTLASPVSNVTVTILGSRGYGTESEYPSGVPLPSSQLEKDLDSLHIQTQQLRDNNTRALRFTEEEGVDGLITARAADRANKLLAFDENGDPTVLASSEYDPTNTPDNGTPLAKLVYQAQGILLGRSSSGTGPVEAVNVTSAKTMLGLDNVNNTTDLNKPISTATQSALDLKAPLAGPTFTGNVTLNDATASRVAILDANKRVVGADTGTYPNLAELAFLKGVTSALQPQILANFQASYKFNTWSTTSTSWTDLLGQDNTNPLQITINPRSVNSRFIVFALVQGCHPNGVTPNPTLFRLMRNGSAISMGTSEGSREPASFAMLDANTNDDLQQAVYFTLDQPSTLSPLTYKIQLKLGGAYTQWINRSANDTNAATTGRGISAIFAFELLV